jgi:hypothetical protein
MRRRYSLIGVLVAALAGTAATQGRAEPVRAVVELFTSQGCSSCPPADALVQDLARQPGVIALTLPVDYWDYLGWKDTLASPHFSKRQRLYAKERGDGQVYTPQTVINGATHHVGSDRAAIAKAVPAAALPVTMTLSEQPQAAASLSLPAAIAPIKGGTLWLMPISRREQVVIVRGENRGKTISYTHVARDLVRLGEWTGQAQSFAIPAGAVSAGKADGFVVVLHGEGGKIGRIIGAVASRSLTTPGS